ncbi:ABC transporter ATP-binding protein [Alkalimarinus alittae]|uniref:ATP-binding cassette domain-containing protein n=1 Tax=Alkalimarinus alittae TaxID=2961619 RepID=A0ABY6N5J3_9ALTE|nr:ATP-binding cassette domain-containing protein [Alkalimarinus alittae]UZE97388.1 ATP-binding cassette domain-containing protein [Alkalimarinus alittae]
MQIYTQQIVGLSGPSGCGKSVFLKSLADLIESRGNIKLAGIHSKAIEAPKWRQKVQLVPAESFWWHNTVGEHFQHPMNKDHLVRLSLATDIARNPVNQLSTGQKQRLALLRSLEKKPQVLLLDEPTGSLDNENTASVESLVRDYLTNNNAAAIWVSHDPEQLKRVADISFKMENGKIESVQR